jgi:ParB family chromosome partitioning protein
LLGGAAAAPAPARPAAPPAPSANQAAPIEARDRVERVALDRLRPCSFQPRKEFAPEALKELSESIREQGILQPLVVRRQGDHFELIAGERRWRAAELCGLKEVPVIVRAADDATVLELALVENLQRENLNPLEEAQGYRQLMDQFQLRQEDVALKVGKSRVAVANSLRLLKLPAEVQAMLRDGRLSVGHAKVILGLPGEKEQRLAAERVVKDGLNVRETEGFVARLLAPPPGGSPAAPGHAADTRVRDPHVVAVEDRVRERLGAKVSLRYRQGRGALEIRFFSDDDLDRILQALGVSVD